MKTASAQEIYERYVSSLPVPEQMRLLAMLTQSLAADSSAAVLPTGLPRRSITVLHGLGKEIWEGIDAQNYVDQLRDEWEQREVREYPPHLNARCEVGNGC